MWFFEKIISLYLKVRWTNMDQVFWTSFIPITLGCVHGGHACEVLKGKETKVYFSF